MDKHVIIGILFSMFLRNRFESDSLKAMRNLSSLCTVAAFAIVTELPLNEKALASMCAWGAATCLLQAGVEYKK